jgi:hypothetical protein
VWNKPGRQATVHAEITEATLQALPAILDPARTPTMTMPGSSQVHPPPGRTCSSPLWWTCTSTGHPGAITRSPWLRWSAAARVGHFRT